jgi:Spy/CpxP family protein refolding chaperone
LLFVATSLVAQVGLREKKEQVKALKIAFITNELDLTTEEAVRFWPIYNKFDEKFFELRHEKMRALLDPKKETQLEKLTEKEASQLLIQMENAEEELHQLRKKYFISLKGIIPSYKIIKLKKAEEDFNKKLLQQYRDKRPRR